ncbi:hypothetical protein [Sphingobacterium cavernae]|uniref:hypothetical protein n=1 Tax=Sphingobacterium cavernae TaxID=2592657 RepID=UPI00123015D7|nr:hypothetical protein [Sphingobacterium cavernae]
MKILESTSGQRQKIGYLISRLSLDTDTKEELIYLHTDGRSTSIRDLKFEEADKVIRSLTSGEVKYHTPKEKMVRKILSMAHEMNWELQTGKVDMDRVNRWCVDYGYLHKEIDRYTESELPQLVSAFENMHLKHLKGLN